MGSARTMPSNWRPLRLSLFVMLVLPAGLHGCVPEPPSPTSPRVVAPPSSEEAAAPAPPAEPSIPAAPPTPGELLRSVQLQAEVLHGLSVQLVREQEALSRSLGALEEASAELTGAQLVSLPEASRDFEQAGDGMKRATIQLGELSGRMRGPATELARSALLYHLVHEGPDVGGQAVSQTRSERTNVQ